MQNVTTCSHTAGYGQRRSTRESGRSALLAFPWKLSLQNETQKSGGESPHQPSEIDAMTAKTRNDAMNLNRFRRNLPKNNLQGLIRPGWLPRATSSERLEELCR